MVRVGLGLLLALILHLGAVRSAVAHATLVAASPADGAVLASSPARFALSFNEAVSPLSLKLIRPGGATQTLDSFAVRGPSLDIALPPDLGEGTHMLSWRVVSEDGHPVAGSLAFSIGQPTSMFAGAAAEAPPASVQAAIWSAKAVLYLALFIGIGGAFFHAWIVRGEAAAQPLTKAALLGGLLAAPASVGLQGLDVLARPLAALQQWPVWREGLATSQGTAAAIAVPALLAGLLGCYRFRQPIVQALSLAGLLGLGAMLTATGHATTASPQWLARPALFLHGVGLGFWIGALAPLATLLRSKPEAARLALRRFSAAIPLVLAILVLAGAVLALLQIDRPDALWTTAYGRIFLAKMALFLVLAGLAAINRMRLSADPALAERLRRSIVMEILVATVILGLVGLWRFTPPPRALVQAYAASVHIHTERAMADLRLLPGRAGRLVAEIDLMTGDIGLLEAKEVTLVLSLPAAGIEPIARPARRGAEGSWSVDDLPALPPGRWSARVEILVSDFELLKLSETIELRR